MGEKRTYIDIHRHSTNGTGGNLDTAVGTGLQEG